MQEWISDQEEVLQQLQGELELVDAQRVRRALLGFRTIVWPFMLLQGWSLCCRPPLL